jgi:hypothetical protein
MIPDQINRYSAAINILLHINGPTYPAVQVGGSRLIFGSPVTFPAGTARPNPPRSGTVVVTIDGHELCWHTAISVQDQPTRIVAVHLVNVDSDFAVNPLLAAAGRPRTRPPQSDNAPTSRPARRSPSRFSGKTKSG